MSPRESHTDSIIECSVARGRALFNLGDYWGAHEALERAWIRADGSAKLHLQGLIQTAAAFHKLIVEDNAEGAGRLIARALLALEDAPDGQFGLAIHQLRAELQAWQARLPAMVPIDDGRVVGIPRIEWTDACRAAEISVDSIHLYRVATGSRRSIVIEIRDGEARGWGECRVTWKDHGTWKALTDTLAPALAAERFMAPPSLPVHFDDLASEKTAIAGIESAVWDLWCNVRGTRINAALGITKRPLSLARRCAGHGVESIRAFLSGADAVGNDPNDPFVIELRPNADRRVVSALQAEGVDFSRIVFDLGEAYRPADAKAIQELDGLGPKLIARPYPAQALSEATRLRSWLRTPLAMGPYRSEREADSARRIGAMDALIVEPLRIGATATIDMAEMAETHAIPLWLAGTAVTPIGATFERALAMHPAFTLAPVIEDAADIEKSLQSIETDAPPSVEEGDPAAPSSGVRVAEPSSASEAGSPPWLAGIVRETWTLKA